MVKPGLVVAVGMNARHLREDALARDGLVGRNGDAAVTLYEPRHLAQATLVDVSADFKMVLEDGLHAGKRRIACPLAQAVDAGMDALATGHDCGQDVAYGKVVVVVGMEVKAFTF